MPPKKKVEPTPEASEGPVAEAVANVTTAPVKEQVVETRNGFSLFSKGDKFAVKNPLGQQISPLTTQEEAEQLFRNMSRKF